MPVLIGIGEGQQWLPQSYTRSQSVGYTHACQDILGYGPGLHTGVHDTGAAAAGEEKHYIETMY